MAWFLLQPRWAVFWSCFSCFPFYNVKVGSPLPSQYIRAQCLGLEMDGAVAVERGGVAAALNEAGCRENHGVS